MNEMAKRKLGEYNNQRLKFVASVERFGSKRGFKGPKPTILLKDVRIDGCEEIITDHLWFSKGKIWDEFNVGDVVSFEARVALYQRGYNGRREDVYVPTTTDYKLERPTKIKKITDV